jgi:hypothetical protein
MSLKIGTCGPDPEISDPAEARVNLRASQHFDFFNGGLSEKVKTIEAVATSQ